jgi:methylenetetrahydrofolate dehydrogenase (NADP+)/methenyltetrahydrofolate cyclohydrolase|nr:bifunctional 5,10-methylenetetrahydrofolate dehydrogenase/5,10-methenyltetrahydrofolate cyclohydrolase [Candidatus Hecatella orcuttiae]
MHAEPIFKKIKEEVRRELAAFKEEGITPGLAAIIATDNPPELLTAKKYVALKEADCREVGIYFEAHEICGYSPEDREKALLGLIEKLNLRDDITGILVQMPLPGFINRERLLEKINPMKDVDGLTPYNKGRMLSSYSLEEDLLPCTAVGIVQLLEYYRINPAGKDAVIVGRSDLVGRPLRILLEDRDATVTCLHRKTKNKYEKVAEGDLVVSAVGRPPELYREDSFRLTAELIKDGAVIVGVGGKRDPATGKMYFDVDVESVSEKASYVTPNIGGVGLMTRARLLKNLISATRRLAEQVKPY